MHKHKYPKDTKDKGLSAGRYGVELATRYIPLVLGWVLFALIVGISLS